MSSTVGAGVPLTGLVTVMQPACRGPSAATSCGTCTSRNWSTSQSWAEVASWSEAASLADLRIRLRANDPAEPPDHTLAARRSRPGRPAAAGGGMRSSDRHTAASAPGAPAQSPNRPGGASPASANRVTGLVRPARSALQNPSIYLGRRHRRLGARRAVAALELPGRSGPAARAPSCLTRAGHCPVVWPHEIPDSGISHRSAGSSPRSGTEAGDISPVFAALEHAAGDFTTLGKNPPLEGSSPPSDTFSEMILWAGAERILPPSFSAQSRTRQNPL